MYSYSSKIKEDFGGKVKFSESYWLLGIDIFTIIRRRKHNSFKSTEVIQGRNVAKMSESPR